MSSMFESISFDMPRPTGWPICFSFGAPLSHVVPGFEAHAGLLQEALRYWTGSGAYVSGKP